MTPSIGNKVTVIYRYWGAKGLMRRNLRTGKVNKIELLDNGHYNLQIKVGWRKFWHFIDGNSNKVAIHGPSLNKPRFWANRVKGYFFTSKNTPQILAQSQ